MIFPHNAARRNPWNNEFRELIRKFKHLDYILDMPDITVPTFSGSSYSGLQIFRFGSHGTCAPHFAAMSTWALWAQKKWQISKMSDGASWYITLMRDGRPSRCGQFVRKRGMKLSVLSIPVYRSWCECVFYVFYDEIVFYSQGNN